MNHESIKETLWAYQDGELPPQSHAVVEAHLQACRECQQTIAAWHQTSQLVFQPLRTHSSIPFVQEVMRKVRVYESDKQDARWPAFVRWAFPALALSISSFSIALMLTIHPAPSSADALLLADQTSVSWALSPNSPSEDQILKSVVTKP